VKSVCANCEAESVSEVWEPGEVLLYGHIFCCSLTCAEAFAHKHGRPGYRRIRNAAHLVVSMMGAYYQGFVEHRRPAEPQHIALLVMGAAQRGPVGWWCQGHPSGCIGRSNGATVSEES